MIRLLPMLLVLPLFSGCFATSIATLLGLGVYGEIKEQQGYCDLPCDARATCGVFLDEDVCSHVEGIRDAWEDRYTGDAHRATSGVTIDFVPADGPPGKRWLKRPDGRHYYEVIETGLRIVVPVLPADTEVPPKVIEHGMTHHLLRYLRGTWDRDHRRTEWCALDLGACEVAQ